MIFRKDITDYLISNLGKQYANKDYKFYEQDKLLYMAEYRAVSKNKITNYTVYYLYFSNEDKHIKANIENKFNVKFAEKDSDVVCRCGKSNEFSAFYGSYKISLRCNNCKNEFSAYSG